MHFHETKEPVRNICSALNMTNSFRVHTPSYQRRVTSWFLCVGSLSATQAVKHPPPLCHTSSNDKWDKRAACFPTTQIAEKSIKNILSYRDLLSQPQQVPLSLCPLPQPNRTCMFVVNEPPKSLFACIVIDQVVHRFLHGRSAYCGDDGMRCQTCGLVVSSTASWARRLGFGVFFSFCTG